MLKGVQAFGPVVRVSNLEEAIEFFQNIGFQCNFKWGDPPRYAVMALAHNDTYTMHLSQQENVPQNGVGLYFITDDVDEIYESVKSLGLRILDELADQPYGMRDFAIEGPDKIHVAVGREIR